MDNENKQIHFTNKDSKKDISLTLDKKMIFIYGKNGSGKTTFSRSNDLDTKFVFNEDFIYKNVYIIDGDGAKIDSGVKNNFSELLVGEDVVELKKKQNKLEDILETINGVGKATITVHQAGNEEYAAAEASVMVVVKPIAVTVAPAGNVPSTDKVFSVPSYTNV